MPSHITPPNHFMFSKLSILPFQQIWALSSFLLPLLLLHSKLCLVPFHGFAFLDWKWRLSLVIVFQISSLFVWFLWYLMLFSSSYSSHFLVHDSSKRITVSNPLGENLVGILQGSSSKDVVVLCHGFRSSKVLFYIYMIKKNAMYV